MRAADTYRAARRNEWRRSGADHLEWPEHLSARAKKAVRKAAYLPPPQPNRSRKLLGKPPLTPYR